MSFQPMPNMIPQPNLLANLAQGLRGAAGVLSPGAFNVVQEQDMAQQALAARVALQNRELAARRQIAEQEMMGRAAERAEDRQFRVAELNENRMARAAELRTRLEERQRELSEQHARRLEELNMRQADASSRAQADREFRRQMMELQMQGRRELASIAGALRGPETLVEVADAQSPTGRTYVPRSQAAGRAAPAPAGATSQPTQEERKTAALGVRLQGALSKLEEVEKVNPNVAKPEVLPSVLRNVPLVGEVAANTATSTDRQRVEAAQLDALDAALTLATGAAYTEAQLKGLSKSYFPQIGDDAKTVQEKRQRFATIVQAARVASGRAEPMIDTAIGRARSGGQSASGKVTPSVDDLVEKYAR